MLASSAAKKCLLINESKEVTRFSSLLTTCPPFTFFRDSREPLSSFLSINEKRWENIENKLHNISARLAAFTKRSPVGAPITQKVSSRQDIVVCAEPSRPPYSLKFYVAERVKTCRVFTSGLNTNSILAFFSKDSFHSFLQNETILSHFHLIP